MKTHNRKKVLFITGTRADYGKLKPLMKKLDESNDFCVYIFVCGMHISETFGSTYLEVQKDNYENIYVAFGLEQTGDYSVNLGNTITHLGGYVRNIKPDIIIVHGDRMDALAGAVVGALSNILVAHIEGGEVSGTVDESIRHAISKFAHIHFVCNEDAKKRLIQMGEEDKRIFVIGSPDIDIMMSPDLPSLNEARLKYDIDFEDYNILMYHPVTTEYSTIGERIRAVVDAVISSELNYVVIYPNSDLGSEVILNEYNRFNGNPHFRVFPSIRFEHFLTLLKNSGFIIGNSSAGIRESGIYGIPAIDIGSRQNGRYNSDVIRNIVHVDEDFDSILKAVSDTSHLRMPSQAFGHGDSTDLFMKIMNSEQLFKLSIQKHFVELQNL